MLVWPVRPDGSENPASAASQLPPTDGAARALLTGRALGKRQERQFSCLGAGSPSPSLETGPLDDAPSKPSPIAWLAALGVLGDFC